MISKTFFTAALCAAAANAIKIEDYETETAQASEASHAHELMPAEEMDHVIQDSYPELTDEEANQLFHDYFKHEEEGSEEFVETTG